MGSLAMAARSAARREQLRPPKFARMGFSVVGAGRLPLWPWALARFGRENARHGAGHGYCEAGGETIKLVPRSRFLATSAPTIPRASHECRRSVADHACRIDLRKLLIKIFADCDN